MQLDTDLRQMIQQARCYPDRSPERRKLVSRMISKIKHSGAIKTEGDDVYQDALQETMKWFGQNCCKFDPERAKEPEAATVISWFNYTLYRYKIPDAKKRQKEEVRQGGVTIRIRFTSETVGKDGEKNILDEIADPIENPQTEIERRALVTAMRHCIQQCRVLTTMSVPDHPEIHCQLLRLLPEWNEDIQDWIRERTWEELEQEFGIPKRKLQNCHARYLTNSSKQQLQNCLTQWRIQ